MSLDRREADAQELGYLRLLAFLDQEHQDLVLAFGENGADFGFSRTLRLFFRESEQFRPGLLVVFFVRKDYALLPAVLSFEVPQTLAQPAPRLERVALLPGLS